MWSSPTIDPARHLLYVADDKSYSDPASSYTDAVIAFNLETGKMVWSCQLTPNDRWNIACVAPDKANCPARPGGDFDFGASRILKAVGRGCGILIAAQKSGIVYGLDPDRSGRIIWETRIGKGGPLGGVEWGGSTGMNRGIIPLSDWDPDGPKLGGGLFALNVKNGSRVWYAPPAVPACADQFGCSAQRRVPRAPRFPALSSPARRTVTFAPTIRKQAESSGISMPYVNFKQSTGRKRMAAQ